MNDLVERLAKLSERGEVEHREIVMNLLIDASAEISRLRDDNDRLRRGLMGAAVFAKPDAEITRLRALNAELVEALEYVWDKVLTEYYDEESPIREKAYRALFRAKGEA